MRKTFRIPLYSQRVVLIVSKDPPNVAAKRHKIDVPFERRHAQLKVSGVTWMLRDGKRIAVCLPPKADINTISHEAMHVAFYLADRMGMEWDLDGTNEHLAYIVGHVSEMLWKLTRA
jgi:hypothetical protein